MTWDFAYRQLSIYLLVFCRMTGVVLFNPILTRRNLPNQVAMALCLGLALLIAPTLAARTDIPAAPLDLAAGVGAELLVGLVWGLIFQIYYYMLFLAGDVIDTGLGLSMAKLFDRDTNIQMSLTGNLFHLIFVLYLFATNSHLLLLRLATASYDIVAPGGAFLNLGLSGFMIELFLHSFSLAIRLALPFLAASFAVEVTMGILMKLVPQINVFSIHFQLKVMMGLILLFIFAVPVANFIDSYQTDLYRQLEQVLGMMT